MVFAIALALICSVMIFFVMSSGRAVNEKINLVNAADAAAYSGAQITARQLNFMAYTNRAMIANEVAIGHSLSFHMEVDLVSQVTRAIGDLLPGFEAVADLTQQLSSIISGIYMLAVDANNAYFGRLQESAFRNFAEPANGITVLEGAMRSVLSEYQVRDSAPISLNDPLTLDDFMVPSEVVSPEVAQAAQDAQSMNEQFCRMVLFVNPSATSVSDVSDGNQMNAYCQALASGGNATGAGSYDNPMLDQGVMLEVLRSARDSVDDAGWVRDRNLAYEKGILLGTLTITRAGESQIEFKDGQLNWVAARDEMNFRLQFNWVTRLLLLALGITSSSISTTVSSSGDSVAVSQDMGQNIDAAARTLLESSGLCNTDTDGDGEIDVECDSLVGNAYRGVQQYTYLNKDAQSSKVTAFVSQSRCSDSVGVDEDGNQIERWQNNLRFLDADRDICDGRVHAISQAEIFYERPRCYSGGEECEYGFEDIPGNEEQPNLFNPFWQARLLPAGG